jgi:hypothetical protein
MSFPFLLSFTLLLYSPFVVALGRHTEQSPNSNFIASIPFLLAFPS